MNNCTVYQVNQELLWDIFCLLAKNSFAVSANPNCFWVADDKKQAFEATLLEYGLKAKEVQS